MVAITTAVDHLSNFGGWFAISHTRLGDDPVPEMGLGDFQGRQCLDPGDVSSATYNGLAYNKGSDVLYLDLAVEAFGKMVGVCAVDIEDYGGADTI